MCLMFLMFLMLINVNFYEIGEHSNAADAEGNFSSTESVDDGKNGE